MHILTRLFPIPTLILLLCLCLPSGLNAQSSMKSWRVEGDTAIHLVELVPETDSTFITLMRESPAYPSDTTCALVIAWSASGRELWRTTIDSLTNVRPFAMIRSGEGWKVFLTNWDGSGELWRADLAGYGELLRFERIEGIDADDAGEAISLDDGGYALIGINQTITRYDSGDQRLWQRSYPSAHPTSGVVLRRRGDELIYARRQAPVDTGRAAFTLIMGLDESGEVLWADSTAPTLNESLYSLLPLSDGTILLHGIEMEYRDAGDFRLWASLLNGSGRELDRTTGAPGTPVTVVELSTGDLLMIGNTSDGPHITRIDRTDGLRGERMDLGPIPRATAIIALTESTFVFTSAPGGKKEGSFSFWMDVEVTVVERGVSGVDVEEGWRGWMDLW